jgi:hypothetical protein
MRYSALAASVAACLIFDAAVSHAQQETVPKAEDTQKVIPEKLCPPGAKAGDPSCTLSDALEKTDGVIVPPKNIDPGIAVPAAPVDSNMPVIKPPGTPGGSPDAQPK